MGTGELTAYWSKREGDLMIDWQAPALKSDGRVLVEELMSVLKVLEARGFDPTTVRFRIKTKPVAEEARRER